MQMLIGGIVFSKNNPIAFKTLIPTDLLQQHSGVVVGFGDYTMARHYTDIAAKHATTSSVTLLEDLDFVLVKHADGIRAWATEWLTEVVKPQSATVKLTVFCGNSTEVSNLANILATNGFQFHLTQ